MTTSVLQELNDLRPRIDKLCRGRKVRLLYLFGSQARGDALPFSDVDFAVLFDPGMSREDQNKAQVELITELMILLHRDDVQLPLLDRASPLLKHRAATEGIVLYEEPEAHADFLVKALQEYDDTRSLRKAAADASRQRHAGR